MAYTGTPRGGGGGYGDHHQQQRYDDRKYDDRKYDDRKYVQEDDHRGGASSSQSGGRGAPLPDYREVIGKVTDRCKARGVTGFKEFSRMFRLYDKNRDRAIDREELTIGLSRYGCDFTANEITSLMDAFDRDGNGTINMTELIRAVRPTMSADRTNLVEKAFKKMDKTMDNKITIADLGETYSVEHHPKFKSGEWTKKQCFTEFLHSFQMDSDEKDDTITKDEFFDYYAGVSANIDRDVFFDYMMRQTWKY